jgi:hypothetical protein
MSTDRFRDVGFCALEYYPESMPRRRIAFSRREGCFLFKHLLIDGHFRFWDGRFLGFKNGWGDRFLHRLFDR